ncbi:MAG: PepSY domain-containing protein [Planctomycetota bacterium]
MARSINWWTRKLHRWGALLMAIPLLVVIVSGLLLQVKKEVAWVQPPTQKGVSKELIIEWRDILEQAKRVPEAEVADWQDIDRLDVRPEKGIVKVRCRNGWELQLDSFDGQVLSSAIRRSDWIESIHDGSFFSDAAKIWLFLPNGIVLLMLWFTGAVLWYLPVAAKRKRKKQIQKNTVNKGN